MTKGVPTLVEARRGCPPLKRGLQRIFVGVYPVLDSCSLLSQEQVLQE